MNLAEFVGKIRELKECRYIKTRRKGDTGVGHTLEQEIGLTKNNISRLDLENIELKAQMRNSSSKITLFTLDRNAWKVNQRDLILKYGYIDSKGRRVFTVRFLIDLTLRAFTLFLWRINFVYFILVES